MLRYLKIGADSDMFDTEKPRKRNHTAKHQIILVNNWKNSYFFFRKQAFTGVKALVFRYSDTCCKVES